VRPLLALYLVGYYLLVIGAAWTLWRSGILIRFPGVWVAIAAIVAIGAGVALALASRRPSVPTRQ
jgi:hypothetical protein